MERRPGDGAASGAVAAGAATSSRPGISTSQEAARTGLPGFAVPPHWHGSGAGLSPSGPGSNCRLCSPMTSPPFFFGMKRAIKLILQGGFDAVSQGSQTLYEWPISDLL
jgi:hypothetical protein